MIRRSGTTLAGIVVAAALPVCLMAAADTHVGWVEEIGGNCRAEWKADDRPTSERKRLDPTKDRYRFLYAGERVRCTRAGSMSIQIYEILRTIKAGDGWCTIAAAGLLCEGERRNQAAAIGPAIGPAPASDQDRRAVETFLRAGGRNRASPPPVFSPADHGAVRASDVVIRWTPSARLTAVRLRLLDAAGNALWTQDNVDGGAGRFDSAAARRALATYRDTRGAEPLTLVLRGAGGDEAPVQFSLLTEASERVLDTDLAQCDKKAGLMRHVCRAYQFTSRQMWNAAADEGDAALVLQPQSTDLLTAAINAHRQTGNLTRVGQLTR